MVIAELLRALPRVQQDLVEAQGELVSRLERIIELQEAQLELLRKIAEAR